MLRANFSHDRHFTSDTTDFIEQLKHQDPTLEARQREGRGRLWDVKLDADLEQQFQRAHSTHGSYVYYDFGEMRDEWKPRNWFIGVDTIGS